MKKYNFEAIDGTFRVLIKALNRLQPRTSQAKYLAGHVDHVLLLQNELVFVKEEIVPEIMESMIFELKFHASDVFCNSRFLEKERKNLIIQVS